MAQELPTADEFFGPKPLPTADEFFAPPQRGSLSSDALGNPAIDDEYLSHSTAGYVLDKFGQGFKDGWGTRPLGLSKESDDWLKRAGIFNDVDSGRTSLLRSFNEQLLRPTATALDLIFNRVPNALYHGTGDVALAADVPRDIVALPEAFPAGRLSGMPTTPALPQAFARAGGPGAVLGHEFGVPEIERAADLGVIGKGEAGYKGLPTPEDLAAQQEAVNRLAPENGAPVARPVSPQPFGPDQVARPVYTEPVGPQAPDSHGAARQIAPDLFAEYDALAQQKEALVSTLGDLADMRDRGTSPALDALDRQIDDLRGQRLEAPASERAAIADRVTALETERATLANELPKTGDTADMAAARQQLVDTDYRMRDLAPDVSAAYRDAAEGATPEPTRTESPAEAVAPREAAPEPEPPAAATPAPAAEEAAPAAAETTADKLARARANTTRTEWVVEHSNGETVPVTLVQHGEDHPSGRGAVLETPHGELDVSERDRAGMAPQQIVADLFDKDAIVKPAALPEPPLPGGIAGDVAKQLVAAGRPAEEANDAGALVEAHYEARAANLRGASAESVYRDEAPSIRAGRGVRRALEFAQKRELGQDADPASRIAEVVSRGEHEVYGLRITEAPYRVGERLPDSRIWDDGEPTSDLLPGTSVVRIDGADRAAVNRALDNAGLAGRPGPNGFYYGKHVALVGGEYVGLGSDVGEALLRRPQVLATFEKADAGLSTISRQLEQPRRGKIRLATDQARATITLFKNADASTFIHESGHAWLEELFRDAGDQRATDQVRADAATVHNWLGTQPGAEIPRQAHEKFARGFERYMMEGHAPSAALAGVFAKFRDWLTRIYETVARLRSPINDDIRGVFDRMLASKDEKPVIAPGEPTRSFADIHEADAAATEPPQAGDAAETVRDERDRIAEAAHPEIEDERLAGRAPSGADGGSGAGGELSRPGGPAPEPDAVPARGVSQPREIGAGRSDAAAEGNRPPAGQRSAVPDGANRQFEPADGLIDRAGNIRLDNLSQPADVDAVIRDAAERNAGFTEQRRGTITDGQMLDLADALGVDPAFLDDKKIGQAFSAEEILAARKLLVQSASAVRDAMLRAADGRPENLAALAQAIARHEMIQGKVAQATAEWGRAGRAFRNLDGWQQARDLNQFLKQNGGRDLYQLSMMARLSKFLQTPGQISKLVTDTAGGKVKQAIVYYWVNTLISGPITHMTYSVGNMLNALWTPLVETPLAAASGAVRDALGIGARERVYFNEVSAQLYGLGKGFRDGLGALLDAWKSGVTPPLPGEKVPAQFTAPQVSPIPGRIGQALGLPGKAVSSIHAFFKFMRYEQNIQALAARDALGKGLDGTARDLHVAKLTASPTSEMMEAAAADALKELYMRRQPYGSAGAQLSRLTNSWLPLKIIAPFVKIGSEIVRNAFAERTPLGLAIGDVRGNLLMREGGAAFDMQLGKVMAGTGLMAATVGAVLGGLMTGDGPSDPNERRVWLLNHKPNSIGVGPLWFSYARLGHLAMLMRFAANMTESGERWNETEGPKLAHAFFDGISRSVLDETWMRGVKDFFDAIYHSEEYFDRWLPRFVAQWTPFSIGLGQVARLADPYQRETRDLSVANEIFNEIHSHIPVWSRSLMPRRDIFGEPITTGSGTVDRYAADRIVQRMDALHIAARTPDRHIRGVPLTPRQYDDYARIGGRLAKMMLDAVVVPGFEQLPPEQQIKQIHATLTHAHEAAAAQIMMQSIGGENDIMKKATDAKAAALHGASHTDVKGILKAH